MAVPDKVVLATTQAWLERAVIGLNLCPFAKAVHARGQVHFAISCAGSPTQVLEDLRSQLETLVACDANERETTLLVVPHCLRDFLEFMDVAGRADRLIRKSGYAGEVQLATFHPDYCFADACEGDMANFSNRSPYPTFHLLRESSIARAVEAFPDPKTIYGANMAALRELGRTGWAALDVGPAP